MGSDAGIDPTFSLQKWCYGTKTRHDGQGTPTHIEGNCCLKNSKQVVVVALPPCWPCCSGVPWPQEIWMRLFTASPSPPRGVGFCRFQKKDTININSNRFCHEVRVRVHKVDLYMFSYHTERGEEDGMRSRCHLPFSAPQNPSETHRLSVPSPPPQHPIPRTLRKFYFNRDWESSRQGGLCTGAARPVRYRPGGWEEFHHWQANGAVGALMEYQVRPHNSLANLENSERGEY